MRKITQSIKPRNREHLLRPDAKRKQFQLNIQSRLTGKRAVIIEDEGITVMHLRKMLLRAGLQVVGTAPKAHEGIRLVLAERPDLVLMDINMPGSLNGLDAAAAVLSHYPVCIIMLTAYDDEERRSRANALQAAGYLIKPVAANTLVPKLEQAFEQWTQART